MLLERKRHAFVTHLIISELQRVRIQSDGLRVLSEKTAASNVLTNVWHLYYIYFLPLHKVSCTRKSENKFSFHSFALPLHKVSRTRKSENKLSFRSFALPLHKVSRTRKSENKLSFRSFALPLHKVSRTRIFRYKIR